MLFACAYGTAQVWESRDGTAWMPNQDFGRKARQRSAHTLWTSPEYLYLTTGGAGGGHVWRYDGSRWTLSKRFGEDGRTQHLASLEYYDDRLFAATEPTCQIWSLEEKSGRWTLSIDLGAKINHRYIGGMVVREGALYAGTMGPKGRGGQVWQYTAGR